MAIPVKPQKQLKYITCPCCGMNRKLDKSGAYAARREKSTLLRQPLGSKEAGRVRFDTMELETALILQVRDATQALHVVGGLTLAELTQDEEYDDLLDQLRGQIAEIMAIIG